MGERNNKSGKSINDVRLFSDNDCDTCTLINGANVQSSVGNNNATLVTAWVFVDTTTDFDIDYPHKSISFAG